MTKKHWLEDFTTDFVESPEGCSRLHDITYKDVDIYLKWEMQEDIIYEWSAFGRSDTGDNFQCEMAFKSGEGKNSYDTLCLIEQMLPISRPVDPACDLDEGLTVLDVLPTYILPKAINDLVVERQQFGLEKYGRPLRVGWDKAAQYSREEIGDLLAYEILNERKWYVTFLAWFFYLFGSKAR